MILRLITKPPVLLFLAVILAAASVFFLVRSEEIGTGIGTGAGKMTGIAVGSYKGVTDGLEKGTQAGREAGLNADDKTMEINRTIQNLGNLEVLVANVEVSDYQEVGKTYAALYLFRGSAVFTVDLTQASISKTTDGEVLIVLPEPKTVVHINDSETELLAEYQRKFFNGNADDGFQAYLKSLQAIDSISLDKVTNYEMLMDMARISAKKQVDLLSRNVCVNCQQITVLFRTES